MNFFKKEWKIQTLIIMHLSAFLLIGSYLLPFTRQLWDQLDIIFFKLINGALVGKTFWQGFWAIAIYPR